MYRLFGRLIVGGGKMFLKYGSKIAPSLSRGAKAASMTTKGASVIKTIETTAVVAGKESGLVKYIPKGLVKLVGKGSGYGKVISEVYKPIKTTSRWKSGAKWIGKALNLAFIGMTAKDIYDYFASDDEHTADEKKDLSLKELGLVEKGANVTKPLSEVLTTNLTRTLAHEESLIAELIQHLIVSKRFIINSELDDRGQDIMNQLQVGDKFRALELLNSIAKAFADDSDYPDLLDAFRLQGALSRLDDSQRTNGLDFILENGAHRTEAFKSACQAYNESVRAFNEELSLSASDEFFEDTTSQFTDLFDLLPWGNRENYHGDQELKGQQGAAFLASSLSTDVAFALVDSLVDRFSVDSDGEDDESAAIDLLIRQQKMSEQNNIARYRLMGNADINASQIYTR